MTTTTEKTTATFDVPNISCNHCVKTITRELSRLDGIFSVEGSVAQKRITVEYAGDARDEILATLSDIGYPIAE